MPKGREGGEGKVPEGNGSHLEIGITFHLQKNKTKKMKIIPLYERYLSLYFDRLGKKKNIISWFRIKMKWNIPCTNNNNNCDRDDNTCNNNTADDGA